MAGFGANKPNLATLVLVMALFGKYVTRFASVSLSA